MTSRVTEAVILMAGSGSRFNNGDKKKLKPLVQLRGRPLISYTLEALAAAEIETIFAVIGFEGCALRAAIAPWISPRIDIRWIDNPQWQLQNGVSALAAAPHVSGPFLLTMGDHLFQPAIIELLLCKSDPDLLNVAIDRKTDSIFDVDDAMKVRMAGERVVDLSKDLAHYNAIDTGLFVCPPEFFSYLEKAKINGDCSLADGARAMAEDGLVRGIDIGSAWWQDIDTPEMLANAEKQLRWRHTQPAMANTGSERRDSAQS